MEDINYYHCVKEYRKKWWKILEIINQIQKENIELNNRHIEYIINDFSILSFLDAKEILQYSKFFEYECANIGLDCKDIILYNFI
jgi:hypothetical protein